MTCDVDWSHPFWSKVHPEALSGCWLWHGAVNHKGYPRFALRRKNRYGNRVAWQLTRGPIPDGLLVLHRCDVPACVNPDHLFLGTNDENMADMVAKGRAARRRGEAQPRARFRERDVVNIRARVAAGERQTDVARAFNATSGQINNIVRRRVWRHVP